MELPHAQVLLNRANDGEKLDTKDRRYLLKYLLVTKPEITNVEMATLFQVTERTIRDDRELERDERAKFLREDSSKDISLVIADIIMCHVRQTADLEKSKAKCKLGTKTYEDHCVDIFDLQLKLVKILQDMGYIPKYLGNMTVEKFEWKATVTADGAVNTRSVDTFEARNAEFEDIPQAVLKSGDATLIGPQNEIEKDAKE
jgi:hypothetical protein